MERIEDSWGEDSLVLARPSERQWVPPHSNSEGLTSARQRSLRQRCSSAARLWIILRRLETATVPARLSDRSRLFRRENLGQVSTCRELPGLTRALLIRRSDQRKGELPRSYRYLGRHSQPLPSSNPPYLHVLRRLHRSRYNTTVSAREMI